METARGWEAAREEEGTQEEHRAAEEWVETRAERAEGPAATDARGETAAVAAEKDWPAESMPPRATCRRRSLGRSGTGEEAVAEEEEEVEVAGGARAAPGAELAASAVDEAPSCSQTEDRSSRTCRPLLRPGCCPPKSSSTQTAHFGGIAAHSRRRPEPASEPGGRPCPCRQSRRRSAAVQRGAPRCHV